MKKTKHCDCHKAKPAEWSIKNAITEKDFFDKYDAGYFAYESFETGKSVSGFCKYTPLDERCRDVQAQREAGGSDRRPHDQGGHLLSVAMGGCSDTENLVPMEGKLNQGEYKSLELDLLDKLKAQDDVFVEISSFNNDTNSQRPDLLTYSWVSRNLEGQLDYGFETFLNEHPENLETEEIAPSEFDEVMERVMKETDPIGAEWLEGKDIAPELLENLAEQDDLSAEIDEAAIEAIAAEFDDME